MNTEAAEINDQAQAQDINDRERIVRAVGEAHKLAETLRRGAWQAHAALFGETPDEGAVGKSEYPAHSFADEVVGELEHVAYLLREAHVAVNDIRERYSRADAKINTLEIKGHQTLRPNDNPATIGHVRGGS